MIKFLLFAALIVGLVWYVRRYVLPVKPVMPRDEAAKLLGVAPDAGADAVNEAHRRLIAKVHPDAGGNEELAARINRARDAMLK